MRPEKNPIKRVALMLQASAVHHEVLAGAYRRWANDLMVQGKRGYAKRISDGRRTFPPARSAKKAPLQGAIGGPGMPEV